jgi:hypothetical protein
VTGPPELHDLVGDDLPANERARLARVHELLVAAGPPPELPPSLAEAPGPAAWSPSWLPRRRLGAAFALAAAIALVAFVGGYIAGSERTGDNFDAARNIVLRGAGQTRVIVRFAPEDANGNRRMLVSAERLPRTPKNNYYILFMTKKGKPIAQCGTFKVGSGPLTTVRFTIGYEVKEFDGLQLSEYRHSDHKVRPLLSAKLKPV